MKSPYLLRRLTPGGAILGESPVWDERTQLLYWVDIERGELHRCNSDGTQPKSIAIGQRLGCIGLRQGAGLIAGMEHSVALLTEDPLSLEIILDIEADLDENRNNDGKCDAKGRFWIGTCHRVGKNTTGWLYKIDLSGRPTRAAGPFICTNGPTFSPDGCTLYCVDSYARTIFSFALDEQGNLSDQRIFLKFEDLSWGYPDGLTCDAEGCLWVAHWGGARVSRFSSDAELLESIRLPVSQPTSCTFGGTDFRTLFITSAALGVDLASEPFAGALFSVELTVGGFAANRYRESAVHIDLEK